MLELLKSKRYSYSGKESYRQVERVIKQGKNVCISSPYIDRYYAEFLLRNSRGKRVRVLASSIDKDAERLLTQGGVRYWPFKFSAFVVGLNAILFIAKLDTYGIALGSAAAALASMLFVKRRSSGILLKVPKAFVHAKMYIADNEAVQGSANLTYSGMHRNVEHIEVVSDQREVSELRNQFQRIWEES